jgi:hypothetical protein
MGIQARESDFCPLPAVIGLAGPVSRENALQITVTLKISPDEQLRVRTTVMETASVQQFGPFPVE